MISTSDTPPESPTQPAPKKADQKGVVPEMKLPVGVKIDKGVVREMMVKSRGVNHRKISGHSVVDIPITQTYLCTTNGSGQQGNFIGWTQLIAQADFTAFGNLFDICRVASVDVAYGASIPFAYKSAIEHCPILLASKLDDLNVATYATLSPLMVIGDKKNYQIFSSGTPKYQHRFHLPKATIMVTSGTSANTSSWNSWVNPQQATGLVCGGIQEVLYVNALNISQTMGIFYIQYNVEWAVRN